MAHRGGWLALASGTPARGRTHRSDATTPRPGGALPGGPRARGPWGDARRRSPLRRPRAAGRRPPQRGHGSSDRRRRDRRDPIPGSHRCAAGRRRPAGREPPADPDPRRQPDRPSRGTCGRIGVDAGRGRGRVRGPVHRRGDLSGSALGAGGCNGIGRRRRGRRCPLPGLPAPRLRSQGRADLDRAGHAGRATSHAPRAAPAGRPSGAGRAAGSALGDCRPATDALSPAFLAAVLRP